MPNLVSAVPVVILAWVLASTSGLMRRVMGARLFSATRHLVQRRQFRLAFDIELIDAGFQRRCASLRASCRRRKRRSCSAGMPAASALASSPPDTTSAPAPSRRQGLQHRQIAIGLDRKGDQRAGRQRAREHLVVPLQRGGGIAIERRADFFSQPVQPHVFRAQHAVLVLESDSSHSFMRPNAPADRAAWKDRARPCGVAWPLGLTRSFFTPQAGHGKSQQRPAE